jgi:asparagine synthase (glutamine-hydrolysing)
MCGILGIVRFDGSPCLTELERGLMRLRHRGPDGQHALDIDGVAAFGHARLAIIDLSPGGRQPMSDESGRFVVTFNGEIYNYLELRRELEALGHRFRSTSDTEVLLAAYARWGLGALGRFDGMFAFGLWDRVERRLVLARDRFGEKPLYYAAVGGRVLFASELSALRATGLLADKPPSVVAWSDYLALGYIPSPLSAHPDVSKLEAASFVVFEGTSVKESGRYWDYADAFRRKHGGPHEALVDGLLDTLRTAVRSRLVSDVPVGAFLSGGLDSSTIVALMAGALPYDLHTFSVGFEQDSYDESGDARLVAERFGTIHHEHRLSIREGADIARHAVTLYDEPFSDTSLVPMVAVAREARKHVTVALSGDGADELMAGYVTYRADQLMGWLARVPGGLREVLASAMRRSIPEERSRKTGWRFKARQFAKGLPMSAAAAHAMWREIHSDREVIDALGAASAAEIREHPPTRAALRHYRDVADLHWLDRHLYVDAKTWLCDDVLVKVDRAAMASSLETRAPYLARGVAEYAAALPIPLKLGRRLGKVALRDAARSLLPAQTIRKPKAGFSAPVNAWFGWTEDNEYKHFNRAVRGWWAEDAGVPPRVAGQVAP